MLVFLFRGEVILYDLGETFPAEGVCMSITPASGKETFGKVKVLTPHNSGTFLRWLSL